MFDVYTYDNGLWNRLGGGMTRNQRRDLVAKAIRTRRSEGKNYRIITYRNGQYYKGC